MQVLTRYLYCALGLLFFNVAFPEPALLGLGAVNGLFAAYALANSILLAHAMLRPNQALRHRLAMWLDIAIATIVLVADPNEIPPSALIYIMVVLGHGMRYGLRIFAQTMLTSFAAALTAFGIRYALAEDLHPGVLFLNLFGSLILIYAFILMRRMEAIRRQLEQSSYRDPLTGLLNRRGLQLTTDPLFADAARKDRRFAVMFADMDRFKQVNDRYGHTAGDRVLRQVGHTLRMGLRESDITGRYGGDEFIVILPQTTPAEAVLVARRLQTRISSWADDHALQCSLSIGIGEAPTHGNSLEAILQHVDQAMYATKRNGGGIRVVAAGSPDGAAAETGQAS